MIPSMSAAAPGGVIVVVGGANVDLLGVASLPLNAEDSNIGRISESPGGVGRNIAENLARLGAKPCLITAFGTDAHGRWLREECIRDGIDVSASHDAEGVPGSRYLAISDFDGDMRLALNDMRALDTITPEALAGSLPLLHSADVIVADTNLSAETLGWLADNTTAPLVVDPVSAAKAPRASGVLSRLHALKLNVLEAAALLGRPLAPEDDAGCIAAACDLIDSGASRVFLTRGRLGVIAVDRHETLALPAPRVTIVNATGAGDAFTAGVAYATLHALPLSTCAKIGSVLATLALGSERTVSLGVREGAFDAFLRGAVGL